MSSMGPVNTKHPKFGECLYCWDENYTRDNGYSFDSRYKMVGPVCKHRLHPFKKHEIQSHYNAFVDRLRTNFNIYNTNYWYKRALLPDWWGEPKELCPGPSNDFFTEIRKSDD